VDEGETTSVLDGVWWVQIQKNSNVAVSLGLVDSNCFFSFFGLQRLVLQLSNVTVTA
jgi:hypothetical protein